MNAEYQGSHVLFITNGSRRVVLGGHRPNIDEVRPLRFQMKKPKGLLVIQMIAERDATNANESATRDLAEMHVLDVKSI